MSLIPILQLLSSRSPKSAELKITLLESFNSENYHTESYTYGSDVYASIKLQTNRPILVESIKVSLMGTFEISLPQDYADAEAQVSRRSGKLYERSLNLNSLPKSFETGEDQNWVVKLSFPSKTEYRSRNSNRDEDLVQTKGCPGNVFQVSDSLERAYAKYTHELRVVVEGIDGLHKKIEIKECQKLEFDPSRNWSDSQNPKDAMNLHSTKLSEKKKFWRIRQVNPPGDRKTRKSIKDLEPILITPKKAINGDSLALMLRFNSVSQELRDEAFNLITFELKLRSILHVGDWDFPRPDDDIIITSYQQHQQRILKMCRFGDDLDLSQILNLSRIKCEKASFSTRHVSLAYYIDAKAQIECAGRRYKMVWPGIHEKIQSLPKVTILPIRVEGMNGNVHELVSSGGRSCDINEYEYADGDQDIFLPKYSLY